MKFNDRIRQRREELNMTQEDLAFKVGYAGRSSIARIELGSTDLRRDKLIKIATALNVSPQWILTGQDMNDEQNLQATIVMMSESLTIEEKEKVLEFIRFLKFKK